MDEDVMIKVEGLSKKFCRSLKRSMFYATIDIVRAMFGVRYDKLLLRQGEFLSLDNLSFEVKRGEALGIIGQNGSGKTTLLRLISGIFPPDGGCISTRGRMGALIAIGAGFHPHMTGRQNIYLNGTIIGMSRKEIDENIAEIIAFADIGDFIDSPVYSYSSGMTVRLGFSIAIHANPDILLADEGLAVGDLGFALKCYRKISQYVERGGTIVLVSHNMQLIRNTCEDVIWMSKGKIMKIGKASEICNEYENAAVEIETEKAAESERIGVHNYDDDCHITKVEFINEAGDVIRNFTSGDSMGLRIHYETTRPIINPIFTIALTDASGNLIFESYSDHGEIESLDGKGHVEFLTAKLPIRATTYDCQLSLAESSILKKIEWHEQPYRAPFINEHGLAFNQGLVAVNPKWRNSRLQTLIIATAPEQLSP